MIEKVVVRPPVAEDDTPIIVPVYLPETEKIIEFACAIHARNKEFEGEFLAILPGLERGQRPGTKRSNT